MKMFHVKHLALVAAIMIAATAGVAVGADVAVPGIVPLDFPTEAKEAHWIWTLLASEVVVSIAGIIFTWALDRIQNSRIRRALLAIKTAVTIVYQEYVRVVKSKSINGRMDVDQKNKALEMAYYKAVEYAKSDGLDLAKVFAKETVMALIEKYVGESKAKAVVAPLPDLLP